MFRKSPSNKENEDDLTPIIANESIENDIVSSDQHVAEGKCQNLNKFIKGISRVFYWGLPI